jgi:hypothetical protein
MARGADCAPRDSRYDSREIGRTNSATVRENPRPANAGKDSLTVNSGTQTGFSITLTAGTNPGPQPTITLTFNSGYSNPPISIARIIGGTGDITDVLASNSVSQSVLTYDGIPQAGRTYIFNAFVLGQ